MSKWSVVKWDNAGGMQLAANAPIAAGEEILREKPLVTLAAGDDALGSHAWDLTHRLLADARLRNTYYAWKLQSREAEAGNRQDRELERLLSKRYGLPQAMVRKLHAGVDAHCIGYGPADAGRQGYGLYETLSRVNHSCDPSATLTVTDGATGELSLVARKAMLPGQEITRNYLDESSAFLGRNFLVRNVTLVSRMGFVCQCPRCRLERPDDLKDVNLLQFFKSFLKEQAEKQALKGMHKA